MAAAHQLEDTATRLFRVRKTVMQMLRDRHYAVADFELNITKEEFRAKYAPENEEVKRENMIISKYCRTNRNDLIMVFFPDEAKVGVKTIKLYVERMKENNVYRAILVVQQNLTAFARQCLSEVSSPKLHLEIFQETELLVNIKHHVLVPEHQVLNDEEKKALLKLYHVRETQLPRMQVSDPISRYYGLRRGEVVKIIRTSETAGRYATYRFVV